MRSTHAIFSQVKTRMTRATTELSKVMACSPRAFRLVWHSSPFLTCLNLVINVLSAFLPIVGLWMTKLLIDRMATLIHTRSTSAADMRPLWLLLGLLVVVWIIQRALDTATTMINSLLRFRVEQHCQTLIMRKCDEFDIAFFENPKTLDALENASQGALGSAWNVVQTLFSLIRSAIIMLTFAGALIRLHWLVTLAVVITAAPQVFATSHFARRRWQMMRDRAEDSRLRFYISWLMTQRDPAKEVRVFGLGDNLLDRFIFFCKKFYRQEHDFATPQSVR